MPTKPMASPFWLRGRLRDEEATQELLHRGAGVSGTMTLAFCVVPGKDMASVWMAADKQASEAAFCPGCCGTWMTPNCCAPFLVKSWMASEARLMLLGWP